MTIAEFQEREYESFFHGEIAHYTKMTVWSPGQTDEFLLGFDGAVHVPPKFLHNFIQPNSQRIRPFDYERFWRVWIHWPFIEQSDYIGEVLSPRTLNSWSKFMNDYFPSRALNLFIQHKRPEHLGRGGKEWHHWKMDYFRFKLTEHQQKTLENLEQAISSKGIVTYSCAAFSKKAELFNFQEQKKIIVSSNFVAPSLLSQHSSYSFCVPGNSGIGHSEPEQVEDVPFLSKFDGDRSGKSGLSFTQCIKTAAKAIDHTMSQSGELDNEMYNNLTQRMTAYFPEQSTDEASWTLSMLKTMSFCKIYSLSWHIIG